MVARPVAKSSRVEGSGTGSGVAENDDWCRDGDHASAGSWVEGCCWRLLFARQSVSGFFPFFGSNLFDTDPLSDDAFYFVGVAAEQLLIPAAFKTDVTAQRDPQGLPQPKREFKSYSVRRNVVQENLCLFLISCGYYNLSRLKISRLGSPVEDASGNFMAFVAGDRFLTQVREDGYISARPACGTSEQQPVVHHFHRDCFCHHHLKCCCAALLPFFSVWKGTYLISALK